MGKVFLTMMVSGMGGGSEGLLSGACRGDAGLQAGRRK